MRLSEIVLWVSKRLIFMLILMVLAVVYFPTCRGPAEALPFQILLDEGWHIQQSAGLSAAGDRISSPGYGVEGWYLTDVPSTVLASLVRNGVYKDPFFGKNLENIPTEQFKKPWWYRKEFLLESRRRFTNARLVFEGINYRANIWLNGKKIASSDQVVGAFRIFEIDVTDALFRGTNALAVEVYPPEPGEFTIGFVDWNPRPPDRNMGLWRDVKLRLSGPVSINHPFVQSKVNLETLDEAQLTVSADLINHSSEEVAGILRGEIENITFNQKFTLGPKEKKKISFQPNDYEALNLEHPRLWWPNNLGDSNLYTLKLMAGVDGDISDVQSLKFGIREVSDYINEEGHRGYMVNGKKVLIRGGGWVDDIFLVENPRKVEAQIRYARHMNLNAIRLEGFWGSSQTLYDLADAYGILIMAGWSCHWEWAHYVGKPTDTFGGIQTPEEIDLISRSLRDQVLWLRNHPSIFVWVLGSDMLPRPELEKRYYEYLAEVDPTRPSLASCGWKESVISGPTAVKMNGPYDYVTPSYWYVDRKRGGAFGFNTEAGPGPQPPPLESIKKMIPEDHLWPIDDVWNFHCARGEFNSLDRYNLALNSRYGKTETVEEYARVAQAANYEAIRAMFEAFGVNKPNTTGIIQWMYNSAWPAMFWQLFDYYLMPSGAFYGTKIGCEPLNIVYNYKDRDIYVVNDTLFSFDNLKAEIRILDVDSKVVFAKNIAVNIGENMSQKILELPLIENLGTLYFIDLKLKDSRGEVRGRNFYWLSTKEDVLDEENSTWFHTPNKAFADLTELRSLPEARVRVSHEFRDSGSGQEIQVKLVNTSDKIAFFIELNVYGEESGNSVLPIFWDDNYVSLLPGETRVIHACFSMEDLKGEAPAFRWGGWNVKSVE